MSAMVSQITGVSIAQLLVQEQIKEKIKAPRHWPLCGEFTGNAENVPIWCANKMCPAVPTNMY